MIENIAMRVMVPVLVHRVFAVTTVTSTVKREHGVPIVVIVVNVEGKHRNVRPQPGNVSAIRDLWGRNAISYVQRDHTVSLANRAVVNAAARR